MRTNLSRRKIGRQLVYALAVSTATRPAQVDGAPPSPRQPSAGVRHPRVPRQPPRPRSEASGRTIAQAGGGACALETPLHVPDRWRALEGRSSVKVIGGLSSTVASHQHSRDIQAKWHKGPRDRRIGKLEKKAERAGCIRVGEASIRAGGLFRVARKTCLFG